MLSDKVSAIRQSLQLKASAGAKGNIAKTNDRTDLAQYSIDVQLSEHNKRILQAFKKSSGFYNSPKKAKKNSPSKSENIAMAPPLLAIDSVECPRIYLFGNNFKKTQFSMSQKQQKISEKYDSKKQASESQNCQVSQKIAKQHSTVNSTLQYSKYDELGASSLNYTNKARELKNMQQNTGLPICNEDKHISMHKQFIEQVLRSLGLIQPNIDSKLQFHDKVNAAFSRYIDMKSNGRWELIQKYFEPLNENQQDNRQFIHNGTISRSIIKKKHMGESQFQQGNEKQKQKMRQGEKKKVKVIQPQSTHHLIKTKQHIAQLLEKSISNLTKGFVFNKYCYRSEKVEQIIVYLSYDLKCVAWQSTARNKIRSPTIMMESMQQYNGITEGPRSRNYQKYLQKNYKIQQQLSFSLIFKKRTLDLAAETVELKESFIEGMKFIKSIL